MLYYVLSCEGSHRYYYNALHITIISVMLCFPIISQTTYACVAIASNILKHDIIHVVIDVVIRQPTQTLICGSFMIIRS